MVSPRAAKQALRAALGIMLTSLAFMTPGAAAQQASFPDDPASPGPYQVGVTTRDTTRTLDNGQQRTVTSLIWYPASAGQGAATDSQLQASKDAPPNASGAPHPLIMFSHGHGDKPQSISWFLSHMASYGFVVVGPAHNDCVDNCGITDSEETDNRRPVDVTSVLDNILALSAGDDPILKNMVDPNSIGMAGKSQGGYTAIRAAEDPRFLSDFALMPALVNPPANDPSKVSKPTMFVVGELDTQVPYPLLTNFFSKIPTAAGDRWFIDIPNRGHSTASTCSEVLAILRCAQLMPEAGLQRIVDRWGTAFMFRYVVRDDRYASLLDSPSSDPSYSVTHAKVGQDAPALPAPQPILAVAPSLAPPAPGTVLFTDDMSGAGGGRLWTVNADANRSGSYVNGEYALKTVSGGPSRKVDLLHEVEAALPGEYVDASVEADVRLMDASPDRHVDVACRSKDPGNDYRLAVAPSSGLFQLTWWWQYQPLTLTDWQKSSTIKPGTESNHLQISCKGTQISASINGTQVASVQHNAYAEGQPAFVTGQIVRGGALSGTFYGKVGPKGPDIEALFSNVTVKQL